MNKLLYFFATVIMLINYGVANEIPYLIKEEITLKAENEYSIRNWLDTTTLRYRIVEINEAALIGDSFTVTIDLFEDVSFNATLKKKITKRGVSWIGDNVKDSEGNTVYLRLAKNN